MARQVYRGLHQAQVRSRMAVAEASAEYPAGLSIEPQYDDRNRLTVFFRIILAIPHLILVGGGPVAFSVGGFSFFREDGWQFSTWTGTGVIGLLAFVCAVISWFAILFASQHPKGLWDLCSFYMRWRVRAVAYTALFRDNYPPFGDADYPASYHCAEPPAERDKLSVGLRIFYVIPHAIVLWFLSFAWAITTIIAWFAILFTGSYPRGLYDFGLGVFRWGVRVESYVLLMRDEYPPFALN
jgi:hypothetical protein